MGNKSTHPRFKYFPWQKDYVNQANIFAPYVMSISQPEYRSSSLNIDAFGFRRQYDFSGRLIDLKSARTKYKECTLLLGNSASFGVSLTSDDKALGHYLGGKDHPCINLSVRGATMQQELSIFLTHKHLLPPPTRIILITGLCDISLATQPEDLWLPITGGMHSINTFFKQHCERIEMQGSVPVKAKRAFLDWAEDRYHHYQWLQHMFEKRVHPNDNSAVISAAAMQLNLDGIFPLMDNVLQTWGWIKAAQAIDVQVVLQPVMGWTQKPRSTIEHECLQADIERIPAIPLYANQAAHHQAHTFFQKSCERNQLGFADANDHFDTVGEKETSFSDICHLTDNGTASLAKWLLQCLPARVPTANEFKQTQGFSGGHDTHSSSRVDGCG